MINTDLENASKIMIGSQEAEAIYVGSNLIWNSVPYDAEIEYLESTGTQYIDTEMYNDNSIVIDMQMSVVGKDRLNGSEYNPNNNPNNRFKWGSNGNGYLYYGYQNNHTLDGVSFTHNDLYTFHLEQSNQHVENSSGTTVLSSQDRISIFSPETIKLFRCYSNGTLVNINGTGSMRIYYCNITNSVKSMQLIPVRVGQVGYLYDKINRKFFANKGTEDFILGPDKS